MFNGVLQGGMLPPIMFFIYKDDLSQVLFESEIYCHVDHLCVNHVVYADVNDLCLMVPYAIVLQVYFGHNSR